MARPESILDDDTRVLILRLGAVGDVLRTLPALHLLRRRFPGAHVSWLVEDLSLPLLEGHPEIDAIVRFPRKDLRHPFRSPFVFGAGVADLRRRLRALRADAALDFQGSLKSGMLGALSGAPLRVGFARGHSREGNFLFTNLHVRPPVTATHRVERNVLLVEAVGARGDDVTAILPERGEDASRATADLAALAPRGAPIVVLSPGTSRRQAYKRWPAARFGSVAAALRARHGAAAIVAWGPGEEDLARAVVAASDGAAVASPPWGLRVLAAALRRSALFIGGDTGPMHLAWIVGCPVVALFGPTDPRLNAPLRETSVTLRRGPRMDAIEAADVIAAAGPLLGRDRTCPPAPAPSLARTAIPGAVGSRR